MNPESASREITKEAVALMRRAASITGNEEIKYAASHIQSEYDKNQHQSILVKGQQTKVNEEPQKVKVIRANMDQRKMLFSLTREQRQNRQTTNPLDRERIATQEKGLLQKPLQQARPFVSGIQFKGQEQQQSTTRRFYRRDRRVDAQGNQINKEISNIVGSPESSGTLSDVSSNGFSENTPAVITMVHIPSIEQKAQQRTKPELHPLQRAKSASTSDLSKKGKNQKKQYNNNKEFDDESVFAKLTLEEAHTLQSIADKTGNRQLKAISSRVQKIVNDALAQTKETKETKEEVVQESEIEKGPGVSVGYLSLIDLIPIEVPQSSICEFCDSCDKSGTIVQKENMKNDTTFDKIESKLPPTIQEFLSGASTC